MNRTKKTIFFICSLAYFVANLDSTIVNVALPAISHDFGIELVNTRNILIIFSFAYGLSIPIGSYLADKYGVKVVFTCATVVFGVSSLVCAMSVSITMLEIARGLQGTSAAFFTPVARSIIVKYSDRDKIITNMANILSFGLFAQTIGPFIGGQIINYFGWKWIFLINIPICILIAVMSINYIRNIKDESCPPLDLFSFANIMITLSLFLYTCEYISEQGISLVKTAILVAATAVTAAIYYFYSRKKPVNIINTTLLKNRIFRHTTIIGIISRQGISCLSFLFILLLSIVYKLKPEQIGNIILFYGLGIWGSKFVLPYLLEKFGAEKLIMRSSWCVFASVLLLTLLIPIRSVPLCIVFFVIGGVSLSIFYGCNNGLTLSSIDKSESNQASTIISLNMYVCQSSSISMLNILLAVFSVFTPSYPIKIFFALIILDIFMLAAIWYIWKIPKSQTGRWG